mmetsp:Transcript_31074/g.59029  ORF Transcript_31074/g.59029 Transcript_31074/m.59029 type:complete len:292 (-) Transcript_31074:613-1488(-)
MTNHNLLPHLFQQCRRHRKRLTNQLVVRDNNGDTRVQVNVIGLCFHGKILAVTHDPINMLFQRIEGVWKVFPGVLLLASLIIGLARHVELLSGIGIILLQNIVEEDVPHPWRNFSCLHLEQQVSKIVAQFFNLRIQMHRLAKDGGAILRQESILRKDGCGVGRIAQRYGQQTPSRNIVQCLHIDIAIVIHGDFAIGLGRMIQHIRHGSNDLSPLRLPHLVKTRQCHIVRPSHHLFVENCVPTDRTIITNLSQRRGKVVKIDALRARQPSRVGRETGKASLGHGYAVVILSR